MKKIEKEFLLKKDNISYHLFSEKFLRAQIYTLPINRKFPNISMKNYNLLIILIQGCVCVKVKAKEHILHPMEQLLLLENEDFSIEASIDESIAQFIWAPGMAVRVSNEGIMYS